MSLQAECPRRRGHRHVADHLTRQHQRDGRGNPAAAEDTVAGTDKRRTGDEHGPDRGGDGQRVPRPHRDHVRANGRPERCGGDTGAADRVSTGMRETGGHHTVLIMPDGVSRDEALRNAPDPTADGFRVPPIGA